MDGDLQDPPEAIAALWFKLKEGFDVVYAIRARRPEVWLKRLAYRAYYRLLGRVGAIAIPVDVGDFCIMSGRVVAHLNALPEHRRFVRGLRAWVGFRQVGVAIDRAPRHAGQPKFTLPKLVALALDGLIGFSEGPTRPAGVLGALGLVGAGLGLAAAAGRCLLAAHWPPGWVWVVLTIMLSGSMQLLFIAIVGEYVSRIFQEVNGRPTYLIQRRVGLDAPARAQALSRRRRRSQRQAWE
jgi:dolichol-phosphate mannosyltransferase